MPDAGISIRRASGSVTQTRLSDIELRTKAEVLSGVWDGGGEIRPAASMLWVPLLSVTLS